MIVRPRWPSASGPAGPLQRSGPRLLPASFPPEGPGAPADCSGEVLRWSSCGAVQFARDYLASRGIGVGCRQAGWAWATPAGPRPAASISNTVGFDNRTDSGTRGLFLEQGRERFAGMITVPDTASGRVRWVTGQGGAGPAVKPRFQAVPGPKPVLGLAALGPTPPWVIVVTEGVFDYLTLSGWGYPACAALGTQGLDKVAAAPRGCPRVFLAFDNDDAGREAADGSQATAGPPRRHGPPAPGASPMWASWQSTPTVNPSSNACWCWPSRAAR